MKKQEDRAERTRAERDLMVAVQNGDRDALGKLVERYAGRLVRYCGYKVSDRQTAIELAELTLLRLTEQADHYNPALPLAPWLYRLARQIIDEHAKDASDRKQPRLTECPSYVRISSAALSQSADERARLSELAGRLEALHDEAREALLLRVVEGLSVAEIALVMETGEEAARRMLQDALLALRRTARDDHG